MNPVRIERLILVGVLLVIFSLVGCTRGFYRRQADREAYCLVDSHDNDPRWQLVDYSIQPSPASRMFDPADPDCEPMPPDDPTAHRYMHCVDCKKGWPCWRCYGKTPFVTNPYWRSYLALDKNGDLVLDRQAAVQTALLNSREYQQQLENLYLSALDVSAQRFRFQVQFFGGNTTAYFLSNDSSELSTSSSLEATKLLATGGQIATELANTVVWQFSGRDTTTSTTLLNFTFLQPFLQGGGRAVALEGLTTSERALLGNARQMQRYRKGFYAQIVAGRSPGPGLNPTGLSVGSLTPSTFSSVGGFLGLLRSQVQIRNQRSNVSGLQTSLDQLQAFYDAGRVGRVQVDQARQSVYNAQSTLLSIVTSYEDSLDSYKVSLGLPPDLNVRIADPLLDRFDLITPPLTETQDAVLELNRLVGDETLELPKDYLQQASALEQRVLAQVEQVKTDLEALDKALPQRRKNLNELAKRDEIRAGQVERSVVDVAVLDTRTGRVHEEFATLQPKIHKTLAEIREFVEHPPSPSEVAPKPAPLPPEDAPTAPIPPGESTEPTPNVPSGAAAGLPPGLQPQQESQDTASGPRDRLSTILTTLAGEMRALSLVQAAARLDTVTLISVDLSPEKALDIARDNRLDWMNARAALVDQWRKIEITANALRSALNLTVDGNVTTVGGTNPFQSRDTNGELDVSVQFDAPLTRLIERNAYRTTLIAYQRARRQYYAYEDVINQDLRSTLRLLRLDQLDFEVRRTAAFNAISQVESAQVGLERPPKPGETGQLSPTTARDLTDALSGLLSAQNSFLGIWVEYEAARMSLDFDLGTMQLDSNGMWIDPGPITSQIAPSQSQPEPIPPGTVSQLSPEPAIAPPSIEPAAFRLPPEPAVVSDPAKGDSH